MAKLTIHQDDLSTVREIVEDLLVVGRKDGASVRIDDPDVGPEHCQIRNIPGVGYKLVDLESRTGTKVNGAFVNQHVLRDGDVIQIGRARITFSGIAPPPMRAAPAAAPAVAAVPAAPRVAVRPAPRSMARSVPPPPRGEREEMVRRPRSSGVNPVIVAGVIVGGLILFLLVATGLLGTDHNTDILRQMQELERMGRNAEALALAKQADPAGNQAALRKIELEVESLKQPTLARGNIRTEDEAQRAFYAMENAIQAGHNDVSGAIKLIDEYIAKWATLSPFWAEQARVRKENIQRRGTTLPGMKEPGGPDDVLRQHPRDTSLSGIDRAFEEARTRAEALLDSDRFKSAQDAYWEFWQKNQLLTDKLEEWKGRVEGEVKAIEDRAAKAWERKDASARALVDRGEYEMAIRIYRDIQERFGIEKYRQQAVAAIKKLEKR
jgi:tetratricopeptide (TPR) repeat protein